MDRDDEPLSARDIRAIFRHFKEDLTGEAPCFVPNGASRRCREYAVVVNLVSAYRARQNKDDEGRALLMDHDITNEFFEALSEFVPVIDDFVSGRWVQFENAGVRGWMQHLSVLYGDEARPHYAGCVFNIVPGVLYRLPDHVVVHEE